MSSAVDELRKRMVFVRRQAENLRPAITRVHSDFVTDRKADFASGGATTGHGAWRPNAASTIKAKGHARILRGSKSGGFQLYRSIVNMRHADHVYTYTPNVSLELGTKHWKARIHQLGLGKGGIRRPIDPTAKQRRSYAFTLTQWVMTGKLS